MTCCKHCSSNEDITTCTNTECTYHETFVVKELQAKVTEAEKVIRKTKQFLNESSERGRTAVDIKSILYFMDEWAKQQAKGE